MPKKRLGAEQIITKLWQVEVLGVDFVKALASFKDDSPYKPG